MHGVLIWSMNSICFLGWICVMQMPHNLTMAGERLDDLDDVSDDLSGGLMYPSEVGNL